MKKIKIYKHHNKHQVNNINRDNLDYPPPSPPSVAINPNDLQEMRLYPMTTIVISPGTFNILFITV